MTLTLFFSKPKFQDFFRKTTQNTKVKIMRDKIKVIEKHLQRQTKQTKIFLIQPQKDYAHTD